MSERTITIEHNGVAYYGHIAKITSTMLGEEGHGILTAYLNCEWPGSGVGVGGFCLDKSRDYKNGDYSREGTAYGLDHILRIMETVGVSKWEDLKGSSVIVLFEEEHSWGKSPHGIAGLHNDKVFILKEHAEEWRDREDG